MQLNEIANHYDIANRRMLIGALRCEQGTYNEAVELDMGLLKTSWAIEQQALIMYRKAYLVDGLH